MRVQFLSFPGCPHAQPSLERLRALMRELAIAAPIEEVDVSVASLPPEFLGWGSPTVLINGRDVAGAAPAAETACRLYSDGDCLTGIIPKPLIRQALVEAVRKAPA